MGSTLPGQMTDGTGTAINFSGIETIIGFDPGIVISQEDSHSLTIGGLFSKFITGSDSYFFEIHIIYTIPYK